MARKWDPDKRMYVDKAGNVSEYNSDRVARIVETTFHLLKRASLPHCKDVYFFCDWSSTKRMVAHYGKHRGGLNEREKELYQKYKLETRRRKLEEIDKESS